MKLIVIGSLTLLLSSCIVKLPDEVIQQREFSPNTKICIIGSSGTGNTDQLNVAKLLEEENCDQVRHLGNMISDFGISNEFDPQFKTKFYQPYKNLIESNPVVPIYLTLGNNDYYGNPFAWLQIAKDHPTSIIFPKNYYAEIWGDVCLFTLDTNTQYEEQLHWLEQLKPRVETDCKLTVGFGHHSYQRSQLQNNNNSKLKEFLDNSILGKFDIYFSGHDNQLSDDGELKGTQLLNSGTAGKTKSLLTNSKIFSINELGYITLEISRDEDNFPSGEYKFIILNKNNQAEIVHKGIVRGKNSRK